MEQIWEDSVQFCQMHNDISFHSSLDFILFKYLQLSLNLLFLSLIPVGRGLLYSQFPCLWFFLFCLLFLNGNTQNGMLVTDLFYIFFSRLT